MGWLVRDGEVLASLDVADRFRDRLIGLLGRDEARFEGALLLRPARGVHTFGMRFPIDVAFLDAELCVTDLVCPLRPNRMTRTRWRSRSVLEARAGSFERWSLAVGDELEVL